MSTPSEQPATEQPITVDDVRSAIFQQNHKIKPIGEPGKETLTGSIGPAPFHPSPAVDPKNIETIEDFEEFKGYLAPAQNALSMAHISLTEIDKARKQAAKNQAWNDYQQLLIVAEFAEKKRDQFHRAADKAHSDMTAAADLLDASLSAPLEQAAAGRFGDEIRRHVHGMSDKVRGEFVGEALKRGDKQALAAILGAPYYLSGWKGPEMQQNWLRQFHEKEKPDVVRRLKATREAIRRLENATPIAFAQVEKAMGDTFQKVEKLRAADTEAKKALLMKQN